jgi:AcrR family transcriptional regulator
MNMGVDRREYHMVARAEAAAATGERILDAVVDLFWEHPSDQIRLEDVANRAGVTVQTVIRRFGSKDGLFAAAGEREGARVREQRGQVTPGDVEGAVDILLDHYEAMGDFVLRLLVEEERIPMVADIVETGRTQHREWCQFVFGPFLPGDEEARGRRVAQFVAICDVYTWKLLRRDQGLSRAQTELALIEMLVPLTKEGG